MHWKAVVAAGAVVVGLVAVPGAETAGASGWALPPVQLAPATNGTGGPAVAMDAAGDAVAVWTAPAQGGGTDVVARTRPAGGDWGATQTIATDQAAAPPSVVLDAHANATAVWTASDDPAPERVRTAQLPAGSDSWGAPHDLPPLDQVQPLAQVAVNADGEAVAAWVELDAGSSVYLVRAALRSPAGAWGAPVTVSDPAGFSAESFGVPQVAVGDDGTAVVAWTAQDNGPAFASHVQEATYGGGTWDAAHELASSPSEVLSPVALATDGAGDGVAAWREDGSPYTVHAALRTGGAWSAAEQLSADVAPTCTAQLAVAAGAPGPAVAWLDGAGGVSVRTHGAGGWSAPVSVYAPPADTSATGVGLAAGAGGTTAGWTVADGVSGAAGVRGAHADASGAWDPATPLASASDGTGFSTPALAADAAGDAIAAWADTDPLGDTSPEAASFTAPPPPPPPGGSTTPAPTPAATAPASTPSAPRALPKLLPPLLSLPGGTLRLARGARTLALRLVNRDALPLRGSARLVYAHRRGTHGPAATIALQPGVVLRARARALLHLRLSAAALHRLRTIRGHAYLVKLTLRLRAADGRLARASATYVLAADFGSARRGAASRRLAPRLTLRLWRLRPRPRARLAC